MLIAFTTNYSFSGRRCPRRQRDVLDDRLCESQNQADLLFWRCSQGYDVRTYVHKGECSYVYEYLYLYRVSKKE
jgi:hypothetical protein